jgi:hypothetical protein
MLLAGLKDEEQLMAEAVDWEKSTSSHFKEENYRPVQLLEEGNFGRHFRIFFDNFYGVYRCLRSVVSF